MWSGTGSIESQEVLGRRLRQHHDLARGRQLAAFEHAATPTRQLFFAEAEAVAVATLEAQAGAQLVGDAVEVARKDR